MTFIPKVLLILSARANKYQRQPESLGTCHILVGLGRMVELGEGHYILWSQKEEGYQKLKLGFEEDHAKNIKTKSNK